MQYLGRLKERLFAFTPTPEVPAGHAALQRRVRRAGVRASPGITPRPHRTAASTLAVVQWAAHEADDLGSAPTARVRCVALPLRGPTPTPHNGRSSDRWARRNALLYLVSRRRRSVGGARGVDAALHDVFRHARDRPRVLVRRDDPLTWMEMYEHRRRRAAVRARARGGRVGGHGSSRITPWAARHLEPFVAP